MKLIKRERDLMRNLVLMKFIKIVVTIKVKYCRLSMVEMKGDGNAGGMPGKKRILPTEISHKFSSKEDFINFFSK
jgi:hypothetical protein